MVGSEIILEYIYKGMLSYGIMLSCTAVFWKCELFIARCSNDFYKMDIIWTNDINLSF